MTTVSTHVLDLQTGRPAGGDHRPAGAARSRRGGSWSARRSPTATAGWTTSVSDVGSGDHLITFETTDHPFYPEVAVVFRVDDGDDHLHIPLLLSRYGYTTYRGS